MSDNTTTSPNPVGWWEIQVSDLEKAKAFYGTVFGWSFSPMGEAVVAASTPEGTLVGALDSSHGDEPVAGRHVRIYVSVDDLEDKLSEVTRSGGEVVQPRTFISDEYGWYATIADPSGVKLGLWTGKPAPA